MPLGTTLLLRSDTTIRASGVVTILGTIKQNTVQPPNSIFRSNTLGGGPNFISNSSNIPDAPDPQGQPVIDRATKKARQGGTAILVNVQNAGATQGLFITASVNQTTVPYSSAVNGSNLTVHAGGPITVGPAALIDLRGLDSTAPTPLGVWNSNSLPSGGLSPNFLWIVALQSASCVPGNCVLQSTQSIELQGNATINCTGGSEGWAVAAGNTGGTLAGVQAGINTYTYKGTVLPGGGYFKYGASGGGGIFLRAPSFNLSATASYIVAPGSMGTYNINTNLYVNGPGAVGNGFNVATLTAPTAGTVQQIIGPPVEF